MFGIDDAVVAAVAPAVIGGAMDLFGGSQTNQANKDIASQANQFSAAQAQQQMQFQKDQRATQYQTAVTDMKKAGLNPMLAYSQGGSGNLAGAQASPSVAHMENPAKGMGHLATSTAQTAIGAANVKADLELKKEQATAASAAAEASSASALGTLAGAIKSLEESRKPSQEIENMKKQIEVMSSTITLQNKQGGLATAQAANAAAQTIQTKQITDAGIYTSNPITQAWGDIKRLGHAAHDKFNPKMNDLINRYDNKKGKK